MFKEWRIRFEINEHKEIDDFKELCKKHKIMPVVKDTRYLPCYYNMSKANRIHEPPLVTVYLRLPTVMAYSLMEDLWTHPVIGHNCTLLCVKPNSFIQYNDKIDEEIDIVGEIPFWKPKPEIPFVPMQPPPMDFNSFPPISDNDPLVILHARQFLRQIEAIILTAKQHSLI
jgi:hypothetical protein